MTISVPEIPENEYVIFGYRLATHHSASRMLLECKRSAASISDCLVRADLSKETQACQKELDALAQELRLEAERLGLRPAGHLNRSQRRMARKPAKKKVRP